MGAGIELTRSDRGGPVLDGQVARLRATGITKSYWRGMWPHRREIAVLHGADLVE